MKQKKRREVYKIYYNIGISEIEGGKEDAKGITEGVVRDIRI